MKRIIIILITLCCFAPLASCFSRDVTCPACGREVLYLVECPICYTRVCEDCADPLYYYESGEMADYLRSQEMLVFYDWNEAIEQVATKSTEEIIECIEDQGYTVIKNGKED